MKKKKNSEKHYSGPSSHEFWARVNEYEVKEGLDGSALYILGCALQDLETRVIQLLEAAGY